MPRHRYIKHGLFVLLVIVVLGFILITFVPRRAEGQTAFRVENGFQPTWSHSAGRSAVFLYSARPYFNTNGWATSAGIGSAAAREGWATDVPAPKVPPTGGILQVQTTVTRPEAQISLAVEPSVAPPGITAQASITLPLPDGTSSHLFLYGLSPSGAPNNSNQSFAISPRGSRGSFAAYYLDGTEERGAALAAVYDRKGITVMQGGDPTLWRTTQGGKLRAFSQGQNWLVGRYSDANTNQLFAPRFGIGQSASRQTTTTFTQVRLGPAIPGGAVPTVTTRHRVQLDSRGRQWTFGTFAAHNLGNGTTIFGTGDFGFARTNIHATAASRIRINGVSASSTTPRTANRTVRGLVARMGIGVEQAVSDSTRFHVMVFGDGQSRSATVRAKPGGRPQIVTRPVMSAGIGFGVTFRF